MGATMKRRNIFMLILFIGLISLFSIYYIIENKYMENNGTTIIEDELLSDINMEEELIEEYGEEDIAEKKVTTGTILATGDIMFHMPQVRAAYDSNNKIYDFTNVFKYVKKYIDSADLSIANFETVTAGNHIGFSGFPRFNSPKETLYGIKDAGFDILTTANNHSLDQGKEGVINTIDAIEELGMKNIGTYKEPNNGVLIEEINEIKLALLSYSYGFNGLESILAEEELSYMVNKIDEDRIKDDIEQSKLSDVDIVVVFIHWGNEYQREPSEKQIELGRKMVEWGANIVFGSHPHVIQRTEIINYQGKDNFIIYSMGNFLSNQRKETMDNRYTEDGIMVKIQLEKDFSKGQTIIKNITYIPTWVRRYRDNNSLKYEILPVSDFIGDEELLSQIYDSEKLRIKESFKDTMGIMTEY